ncbi:MAG: metal-dependent hydrolase [Amphritea sp.]
MDSLTHLVLGAAVGQAVLGRKVGYRAAIWGGVCATLPDLDVFISMGGAVADFTYHRSFSHSLFMLVLITPLVTWLILKFHPQKAVYRRGWFLLVLLALTTHPLLDSFTVYGTQLFWPLGTVPVGLGSIFIIDPLYTLPLLLGLIAVLSMRRNPRLGQRLNTAGLLLSSLYLVWSIGAQSYVQGVAKENMAALGDGGGSLLVTPAPFNTLLWRVLVMNGSGYRVGFYSLLDEERSIRFVDYSSQSSLLDNLQSYWPVRRLQWFTRGFYKVENLNDAVVISDLRMGVEPEYQFSFKVADISNPHPKPAPVELLDLHRDWEQLPALIRRIWVEPE